MKSERKHESRECCETYITKRKMPMRIGNIKLGIS